MRGVGLNSRRLIRGLPAAIEPPKFTHAANYHHDESL